jgi:hypothetical protein
VSWASFHFAKLDIPSTAKTHISRPAIHPHFKGEENRGLEKDARQLTAGDKTQHGPSTTSQIED